MARHERATLLDGSASAKLRAERANAIRLDQELAQIKRNAKARNKSERLYRKQWLASNPNATDRMIADAMNAYRTRVRVQRINPNGTDGLRFSTYTRNGVKVTEREANAEIIRTLNVQRLESAGLRSYNQDLLSENKQLRIENERLRQRLAKKQ